MIENHHTHTGIRMIYRELERQLECSEQHPYPSNYVKYTKKGNTDDTLCKRVLLAYPDAQITTDIVVDIRRRAFGLLDIPTNLNKEEILCHK